MCYHAFERIRTLGEDATERRDRIINLGGGSSALAPALQRTNAPNTVG
jgi:hypothetical protein